IPPPPPDVDFSAVNGAGPDRKPTARLRLEQHRTNPTCASCHSIIDPPGLTLEKFDALGQGRDNEDGAAINVKSEIAGHSIVGAAGLGQMMHESPQAANCLVRNLFATGAGRTPGGADFAKIPDMTKAFVEGGYRVPAFLKTAAKNEAFFTLPKPKPAPAA